MKSGSLVLAAILLFGLLVPNVSAGAVTVKNGLLNATGNLYAGFDGLFVDSVLGRVGIGTLNPQARLDVNGSSLFNGIMNLSNNRIIGLAAPINGSDAVNKDYVDALGGNVNATVYNAMPLQGVIDYDAKIVGAYMNTIPLSLPKANCGVKITACNNAPTAMVIGADPVSRQTKNPINVGGVGVGETWGYPGYPGPSCESPSGPGSRCPLNYVCQYWQRCCPEGYGTYIGTTCYPTNSSFPYADTTNNVAYNNPRCPSASAGQVYIQYIQAENTCAYCPTDHPVYDPTSKNCIKNTTITTNSIGGLCSTINTYLPTAFTDVTFLNASSMPTYAYNIRVAYNCPSD